jgi:integrase
MQAITERIRSLPLSPDSARLRAILCLLGLQGLRQIEVTRLDVADLDLAHKTAMVRGKGRDDKEPVDLHPETVRSIREHLETNRLADGPLFVGRSNNSRRLTTRGLRLIIGQILKELGIDKTVHGFRHYFVTSLIRSYAGDLLTVAQYTRHRSLEMLQVYNDNIKRQEDLPRFYRTFQDLKFTEKPGSTSHK